MVRNFKGVKPKLGTGVWIAPTATVIGDVELGENANVWFGTVIRGDVFPIRVGRGTNIQDNCVLHVSGGEHPTTVGEDVTVGHGVTLHGCTIGDRALVGIGSIVLDGAVVGEEAMIGAGSLVTPGTVIPPRVLALGSPCRVKRPLTEQELAHLQVSAPHYVQLAQSYAADEQG